MNQKNNRRKFRYRNKKMGRSSFVSDEEYYSRMNAAQRKKVYNMRDQYLAQAKDALSQGDRVDAEYYYQHAEHYQRILNFVKPNEDRKPHKDNDKQADNDDNIGNKEQPKEASSKPFKDDNSEQKPQPEAEAAQNG